jgi:hypothetical protein
MAMTYFPWLFFAPSHPIAATFNRVQAFVSVLAPNS